MNFAHSNDELVDSLGRVFEKVADLVELMQQNNSEQWFQIAYTQYKLNKMNKIIDEQKGDTLSRDV